MQSKMVHDCIFIALVRSTETFWRFIMTTILMPESTAVTQTKSQVDPCQVTSVTEQMLMYRHTAFQFFIALKVMSTKFVSYMFEYFVIKPGVHQLKTFSWKLI